MGRGGLHPASFLGPDVLGSLLRADKIKREQSKQASKQIRNPRLGSDTKNDAEQIKGRDAEVN